MQHQEATTKLPCARDTLTLIYEGKSISKLQIQVATYVFELSAGNCQC